MLSCRWMRLSLSSVEWLIRFDREHKVGRCTGAAIISWDAGSDDNCEDDETSEETLIGWQKDPEWVVLEFSRCLPREALNTSAIQANMARWMNEECATAIKCCLKAPLQQHNIIVGEQRCSQQEKFITLLAVKEYQLPPRIGNVISARLLGAVIRSREHLLSILVQSDLKSISVRRLHLESSAISNKRSSLMSRVPVALIFVLLCISLALCVVRQLSRRRSPHNCTNSHIALRSSFP
ncbi:unnamed protein product [Toxocara canis]|uniref:Transmembrane protein n=1 Tax=Toxocara canis TaxID=6265 RepID=A0A183UFY5_TOXCA|nr:unnamed protein product [Toxocara canis]